MIRRGYNVPRIRLASDLTSRASFTCNNAANARFAKRVLKSKVQMPPIHYSEPSLPNLTPSVCRRVAKSRRIADDSRNPDFPTSSSSSLQSLDELDKAMREEEDDEGPQLGQLQYTIDYDFQKGEVRLFHDFPPPSSSLAFSCTFTCFMQLSHSRMTEPPSDLA